MTTLIILLVCIPAGYLLRNRTVKLPPASFVTWLVWALLFLFGISIGANRSIIAKFDHFGLQAVVLALMTAAGSALAAFILLKLTRKRKSDER